MPVPGGRRRGGAAAGPAPATPWPGTEVPVAEAAAGTPAARALTGGVGRNPCSGPAPTCSPWCGSCASIRRHGDVAGLRRQVIGAVKSFET